MARRCSIKCAAQQKRTSDTEQRAGAIIDNSLIYHQLTSSRSHSNLGRQGAEERQKNCWRTNGRTGETRNKKSASRKPEKRKWKIAVRFGCSRLLLAAWIIHFNVFQAVRQIEFKLFTTNCLRSDKRLLKRYPPIRQCHRRSRSANEQKCKSEKWAISARGALAWIKRNHGNKWKRLFARQLNCNLVIHSPWFVSANGEQ